MFLVLNPPGHHVTPVPQSEILVFDRSLMMRPPQFNLSGARVFQIICEDPDPRRVYNVNLHLSEALLTYHTTCVLKYFFIVLQTTKQITSFIIYI